MSRQIISLVLYILMYNNEKQIAIIDKLILKNKLKLFNVNIIKIMK